MGRHRIPGVAGLVCFLLLAVVFLGWGIYRKDRLDDSSLRLAVNTTESIFTDGNAAQLVAHAHLSLLEQMPAESLEAYLNSIRRTLGPLDAIQTISGSSAVSLNPLSRAVPAVEYEIELVFSGRPAKAIMTMLYQQGAWQFTDYNIESALLYN